LAKNWLTFIFRNLSVNSIIHVNTVNKVPVELFNIDKGYSVFSKGNYQTAKHSHYAIEIVFCTEGSFSITTNVSEYTNIKSVIIPSNLSHSFSCINAACNLLFLDPLSDIGTYFLQQYNLASQKSIIVNSPELNQFHDKGEFNILLMLDKAKTNGTRNFDFRILKCIETINSTGTDENLTVNKLSKASFLSESRLAHLFKKQLGISVHQCILWKKILLAVLKSREGYSLTECAHYVGFSDSSHFNKVFYKMFGVNPFFVLKD
jgi:AraC-like DNA-binding protein